MTQIKHTERLLFETLLSIKQRHARKMAYTLLLFSYTAYRYRSAQVKVRGILSNASCVEEKEKWNHSYVTG